VNNIRVGASGMAIRFVLLVVSLIGLSPTSLSLVRATGNTRQAGPVGDQDAALQRAFSIDIAPLVTTKNFEREI
jgi:hypothetical protein